MNTLPSFVFAQKVTTTKKKLVLNNQYNNRYDQIVFACGAPAVSRITKRFSIESNSTFGSIWSLISNSLLQGVLSKISYTESRDRMFLRGSAHSDASRVLPSKFKNELLKEYCNYVEVQRGESSSNDDDDSDTVRYENSFIISSWCPPTLAPGVKGKRPMLVSYNCEERLEGGDINLYERNVNGKEAHPCLTMTNLALSNVVWPWFQGMQDGRVYFCGSYVTPGNGHDLSMLSGLVVASKIGAKYPFQNNDKASEDFFLLQKLMGISSS